MAASHPGDRSSKSLHVWPVEDGRLAAKCHSHGCPTKEIATGLEQATGMDSILSGQTFQPNGKLRPALRPKPLTGEAISSPAFWESTEDIARAVAHRCLDEGLGYRFDTEHQEWLQATDTHWERVKGGFNTVSAQLSKTFRRECGQLLGAAIAEEKNSERRKVLNKLLNNLRERAWTAGQFRNALELELAITLRPPDMQRIPTAGGVVYFEQDEHGAVDFKVRPFDPLVDSYRAAAPAWPERGCADRFAELMRQWIADPQVRAWLQLFLGAALIGQTHRAYLCLTGPAGCGKSTCAAILHGTLGDLMQRISPNTFDEHGAHNAGLVKLIQSQARLADLPEAHRITAAADVLNRLTGGDPIVARRPYGRENIEGTVQAMPIFVGETVPSLKGMTPGTAERQRVVRFQEMPEEKVDPLLFKKADSYRNDGLAWLLKGACLALEAIAKGKTIDVPEAVQAENQAAMAAQSPLLVWLMENPAEVHGLTSAQVLLKWQEIEPNTRVTASAMGREIAKLSKLYKQHRGRNGRTWVALGHEETASSDQLGL